MWAIISRANKYIDETTPWVLARDEKNKDRLYTVLYNLAETLRIVSVLVSPVLTKAPGKIQEQLGITNKSDVTYASILEFGTLNNVKVAVKPTPIFPRLEMEKEVQYIKDQMNGKIATTPLVEKPTDVSEIGIDDFTKLDLRIGQILSCKKHPNADRLLVSEIDLGYEKRQIVSGIAKFYQPEELINKKVIVVSNLKPVKLRGELSQGMILAASFENNLTLPTILQDLPNGSQVK